MYCCRYRYDPLDRVISHTHSIAPRHRFYCKTRLVTEIQGALRHSIVQHGDLLLAQQQHENDVFGTALLATDLQRSVLHTLEKNTESQPIAYSPYGHRSAESGLTSLLGFNGERPDPVTGHYLLGNGYRAFNPVLMRFNNPDSWSPFGKGGLNAYEYCKGDPVNLLDQSGHFATKFFPGVIKLFENLFRRTPATRSASKLPSDMPLSFSNEIKNAVRYKNGDGLTFSSNSKSAKKTVMLMVSANGNWDESTSLIPTKEYAALSYTSSRGGINGHVQGQGIRSRAHLFPITHNGIKTLIPADNFHNVEYGYLTMKDFESSTPTFGPIARQPFGREYYPGLTTPDLSKKSRLARTQ